MTPIGLAPIISKTAGDTDLVAMEYLYEMGYGEPNGLVLDVVAANIVEKPVYHTVNGNRALFHTSKTAKMITVTKQHVDILTRFSK